MILDPNDPIIETTTLNIGSKGIIAVFFKELGLVEFVDSLLPKNKDFKVSNGECLLCLALIGFSLSRRALYKVYEQMESLPIPALFGRDIDPNDFNDDVLGRFFDAVYNYGTSAFFMMIVNHIHKMLPGLINIDAMHTDITNFSVHGDYANAKEGDFKIVQGHAKNGCHHLKLFSLALIANSDGIPIFMKELSGNCSDQKEIIAIIKKAREELKNNLLNDVTPLWIADAAFYNCESIKDFSGPFLTRTPETINEVKQLISTDVSLTQIDDTQQYSYYATTSQYGGVPQQYFLFHSQFMAQKKEVTFDRKIMKEKDKGEKALRAISRIGYACEKDALREAQSLISGFKHLEYLNLVVTSKQSTTNKRGRPKNGEERPLKYYVAGELGLNNEIIERERQHLGRFVLATNDFSLSATDALRLYKEQSKVEKGFRYLKNNDFQISVVLLKNHERIQALCCYTALMLLI
jgi:transposase